MNRETRWPCVAKRKRDKAAAGDIEKPRRERKHAGDAICAPARRSLGKWLRAIMLASYSLPISIFLPLLLLLSATVYLWRSFWISKLRVYRLLHTAAFLWRVFVALYRARRLLETVAKFISCL